MLKKLRTIFQAQAKEEPGLTALSSENLPLWLAEERDKARCELEAATSEFRPRVLAAIQAVRQGLGAFSDMPDTGGVHPKLGRVLKNAGPEFARAMKVSSPVNSLQNRKRPMLPPRRCSGEGFVSCRDPVSTSEVLFQTIFGLSSQRSTQSGRKSTR